MCAPWPAASLRVSGVRRMRTARSRPTRGPRHSSPRRTSDPGLDVGDGRRGLRGGEAMDPGPSQPPDLVHAPCDVDSSRPRQPAPGGLLLALLALARGATALGGVAPATAATFTVTTTADAPHALPLDG